MTLIWGRRVPCPPPVALAEAITEYGIHNESARILGWAYEEQDFEGCLN